jgi:hypothetical protein
MAKASRRPQATSATIHAQKLERGEGGELHQVATGDMAVLTTAQGGPISDDQNSLKVGERGPTVLEDFHFREKIFHYHHSGRARAHLASLMQISGPMDSPPRHATGRTTSLVGHARSESTRS